MGSMKSDPGGTRAGRPRRPPVILEPLRHRDFRLLWSGMTVSLIGDGIFLVALAWQVYELSDAPTALSLVGLAMTIPHVVFLLLGGVVSDRFDRRTRDARRRPRPRALGRRDGRAVPHGAHRALAPHGPRRDLRGRHRVLRSGVRRDRPRPRGVRAADPGELARPVRPAGGLAAARARRSAAVLVALERRRRVPAGCRDVRGHRSSRCC